MILGTVSHGRTGRDTGALLAHLSKQIDQVSRVVGMENVAARDEREALRAMEILRDGSGATVAIQHMTISPKHRMTDEQRDEALHRILVALDAEDHAYVLWEHSGKARKGQECDHHFHLALAHVGPDLKALDMGGSYARLEAVARGLEFDWGEDLTDTRRHAAVAAQAERMGRGDVAAAIAAMRPEDRDDLPRSAMTTQSRAAAVRAGQDLPQDRANVAAAWAAADTPAALRAALAEHGLAIAAGDKPGVWLVMRGEQHIGALDRLAGERRKAVDARMTMAQAIPTPNLQEPAHERPAASHADRIEHLPADHASGQSRGQDDRGSAPRPEGSGGDAWGRDGDPRPDPAGGWGRGEPGVGSTGASAPGPAPSDHGDRADRGPDRQDRGTAAAAVAVAKANADPRAQRLVELARDIAQAADRSLAKDVAAMAARLAAVEGRAVQRIEAAKQPPRPPTDSVNQARADLLRLREISDAAWRETLDAKRRVEDIERSRPSGLWAALSGKTRKHAQELEKAVSDRESVDAEHVARVASTKASKAVLERAESRWNGASKVLADQAEKDAQEARKELVRVRAAQRCLTADPALARDPAALDQAAAQRLADEQRDRTAERLRQATEEARQEAERQALNPGRGGPRMR